MFDAAGKFVVTIANAGTEAIVVAPVLTGKPTRVLGCPTPTRLEPGESMQLIGYEPGTAMDIKPADRIGPVGILDPVPTEFGKPGIIERATQDLASFPQRPEDFDVDLHGRKAFHRATGICCCFNEQPNQQLWDADNSVAIHDNPCFHGDRQQLAQNAKRAAIAAGMTYRRPSR